MSLYDDLGVTPDATEEQIAAAFRRAAKQHHPDTGGERAKFQRAQAAATILRDPAKRAKYDANGTIEDRTDNALAEVMDVLSRAFESVFSQVQDLAHTDVAGLMNRAIQQKSKELKANKAAVKSRLDRSAEALKRLRYQGNGQDLIANILRNNMRAIDRQIVEIERVEAIYQAAQELAKDYSWAVDRMPQDSGPWNVLSDDILIKWPQ